MDTIAMHAAGFQNAVATLGTAITQEHARLISRYTKRVIINYDSDEAGQKAADKAMLLLDEVGLPVRVLKLTGAKDADEFIKRFGNDAFYSLLKSSDSAFNFKMEKALAKYDLATADGKLRAARELTSLIAATHSSVERELYLRAAAERLGISAESLSNDVLRLRKRQVREAEKKSSRDLQLVARNFGDRVNPDAAKEPATAAAEDVVLGLCLAFPEHRRACATGDAGVTAEDFFTAFGKRVFTVVTEAELSAEGFSFSALGAVFSPDEMGRLVKLQREREMLQNNGKEVLALAVDTLHTQRRTREAKATGDWQSELAARRAQMKKKNDSK